MPHSSPRVELPYLQPSQAQKDVTHNEALQRLDAVTQLCLLGFADTEPPELPAPGDIHGLGSGPTGVWAGHGHELAYWSGDQWLFLTPKEGWRAWGVPEQELRVWRDGQWQAVIDRLDDMERLGVNTSADATNRLAVASDATLLSHAGSGHQLKLNKAATGDTASLLFQSNWAGHAEMGLAGTNDWSIKLSPDGASWIEALRLDNTTGLASGEAIQKSATDTTEGRLARADFAYSPGNLLGTVSQSSGDPTGAVIERGSNSNGEYVRFADGTQICWYDLNVGKIDDGGGTGTRDDPYYSANVSWTYPAAFVDDVQGVSMHVEGATHALSDRSMLATYFSRQDSRLNSVRVYSMNGNASDEDVIVPLTVIGRWF
ncbi:MAG: Protein of unknown function (DUF2793) [Rhodobacteraceae bacterium HLUCCO07]|nr:MAG: Protein of unknown function (DUF2793) [Rhodobacteraceae bacterium HLUCCO07]